MILEGYDMPSVLCVMKEMKENRESIYMKTQIEDTETTGDMNKENYALFTPKPKKNNDLSSSDLYSQRTKDEDWTKIFELYDVYIKKIADSL